ncbi:MAG: UDP-galactopyranose mutase [FCB group bacterium]|nr:UDP-galactopyranose mutase [FCB group bacterium]MBL7027684.1 UDP-galactopyranose mutase [Candidatus Neomarinimicrobiota bacterium]MBL7121069.1 UDP-galactopyranose mutase [Candidatus Neomarinimicrobiota bacterium]
MSFERYKYVVVGSGFFGAVVAERIASELSEPVLVLEKREHTGGNCHSADHAETGIHYHRYGTHIFHTSNQEVWDYICKFTDFNGYHHQVLTTYQDKVYQMPINLETINNFYNLNLKPFEVSTFIEAEVSKSGITNPGNFEEKAISMVGRTLYEAFIKGYTAKQWGCDPSQLPATLLQRLPFRTNYDENYFFDPWQGIPLQGYSAIFDKLLASPKIQVELNTDFLSVKHKLAQDACIVYTGPLDKLFDYRHGQLEWRSLSFQEEVMGVQDFQGTSVMNYAEESILYTRIHEPRHLHPEKDYAMEQTLTIKEYSHQGNSEDPYYPVGGEKNKDILKKYRVEVSGQENLFVGGRLGDYKYYDMDQTIAAALRTYKRIRDLAK